MYSLDCYVNSLYTIFLPHTTTRVHTHTHTHRLVPLAVTSIGFSFSHCFHEVYMYMYMCMNVHTHCYVHSPYTIYLSNTHTYSTLCIVTEMKSCAQQIHTLMYSTLVRSIINKEKFSKALPDGKRRCEYVGA